ncbi:MAG TPA: acyltransferase [Terriglobales bacterium]|jgi:peptidoglycan/LPS O-acetylase OafA/YrhL|nr:acyltransferase [Terriglobales bacterium]
MPEQRNSTNFLRVLAIALVVNSHMDNLYPVKVAFLATGGSMGNALFFMLSSWGLMLSMRARPKAFGEWYGRRIVRIYPAVWVTVILLTFPMGILNGRIGAENFLDELGKFFYPPFWFLEALLIYYAIVFFVIRKYSVKRLVLVSAPVVAAYAVYYVFFLDITKFSIEGTPFRLLFYLLVVLWGVYLGSRSDKIQFSGIQDVFFLFLSIACIYGHKYLMQRGSLAEFQFVQQLASFPMLYFWAKVANSSFIRDTIMGGRYLGRALTFVSGMTLEIFMVNNSIDPLDSKLGSFPLNVIALISINIALALIIYYCAKPIRKALESDGPARPPVTRDPHATAEVAPIPVSR